jgi:hypothetical protein
MKRERDPLGDHSGWEMQQVQFPSEMTSDWQMSLLDKW